MIQPVHDYVLVKTEKPAEKTESGIILPNFPSDKEFIEGIVVEVGKGIYENGYFTPMPVSKDDTVLIPSLSGFTIDKDFRLVKASEILAKILD